MKITLIRDTSEMWNACVRLVRERYAASFGGIRPVLGVLFAGAERADARARCRDYQNAELNFGRAS